MADTEKITLDELIAQEFVPDFRTKLERLLADTTAAAVAETVHNFATALACADISCTVTEVDGKQHIALKGHGLREVTTVTKHDAKGRILEFVKTSQRA